MDSVYSVSVVNANLKQFQKTLDKCKNWYIIILNWERSHKIPGSLSAYGSAHHIMMQRR